MTTTIFNGITDRYNGVTVDSNHETCESHEFPSRLSESLKKWIDEKKKCAWFKIYTKDADWIPILANDGFDFHHARNGFVMMYKSLLTDRVLNLPPASHTNLGVGAVVLNDKNQILVVTENHYLQYPHWKLPGGYVERGEDIQDAAVREVKEETGIDAVFESLVTLRHTHNTMFGNSDIYVVVILKAVSETISKCDVEIKECKWMDIDEYLEHPNVHDFNRSIIMQALDLNDRKLKLAFKKSLLKIGNFSRDITTLVLEDS